MIEVSKNNYYPLTKQERERVDLLEAVICETFGITNLFQIINKQEYVTGRTIFCWLLNKYSFFGNMHPQKISGIVNRSYGTVKHMIQNHENWYHIDSRYCNDYHDVGAAYSRALQCLERLKEAESKMNEIQALVFRDASK